MWEYNNKGWSNCSCG
uniref:Uncharacterized protein n=1 Tax=Arundo donax TaxID=35708 RepID=A0A0A9HX60_ARUDO